MARLLTAGAEEGSQRSCAMMVNDPSYALVMDASNQNNVIPRTGDYMYALANSSGNFQIPQVAASSALYMGMAIYIPSGSWSGGNWFLKFNYPNSGVYLDPATGITILYTRIESATQRTVWQTPTNRWCYMEIYYLPHSTTGRWTVKIDGVTVVDFTGVTQYSAAGVVGGITITSNGYIYLDDIVVNDSSGSVDNTFPGQPRLYPLRIRGAGDVQGLTRKGVIDLGFNHSQLREASGNGDAWLEGTTGQYDLAAIDALVLPIGGVISKLIVEAHVRGQSGGGVNLGVKSSTTESWGSSQAPPISWGALQQIFAVDPATGIAWTQSGLATLQAGIKVT